MVEERKDFKECLQQFTVKALKATIKGIVFYGIYFFLSLFLAPISEMIPGFQQTIENFVIVYILLMVIGELSAGTIYQHFFNASRALFVILYLLFSLKGGTVGVTFQDLSLAVDLSLFLVIAMLLGLLGLAKSVLQAIDFLNKKAELPQI